MVFSTDAWDKRGEVHTDAALAVALGIAGTCSRNDAMMTAPEVRALSLSSLCQGCVRRPILEPRANPLQNFLPRARHGRPGFSIMRLCSHRVTDGSRNL